ncbi:MAG: transporter [Deltaproteobacteria bacterium]|nr:transporter [Deltaproteobacteria bacterium]
MTRPILAIAAIIIIEAFPTIIADYFLKVASLHDKPVKNKEFLIALLVYSLTVFPWVYIMKYLKLATIAVVYSLTTVILLTLLGVFVFNETLNHYEVAGVIMAITSIILLSRFA